MKTSWRISGLLLLTLFASACSNGKAKNSIPPPPVIVGLATKKTVPVELRAIGNVQAFSTVMVKSKVGGELVRVHFIEGQDVKKGDLLLTVDPRPYEAAFKETEANLQRDLARARNAAEDARRYESLIQRKVVSTQLYEKIRSDADALEATVLADKAAVENAKIQLDYCSIRSPIDGRTGSLSVKQGNIIKADDITLIVINQIIPIDVSFSVPEQFLPEIQKRMASKKLHIEASSPQSDERSEKGTITFVDNAVDTSTGTIRLKGAFANRERKLWPGQFVNVVLTLTEEPNVIVVPSQAIQTGQEGQYVFVVKPDLTVESRPVVAGRTISGETVVQKGLQADERVVTDGQLRLYPGAKVEIKTPDASSVTKKKAP
ncbi:MAG: efflux RND transporter periplasmic adaptor subunit [Desulfobacterales bacterium]|nr:efflux RND transporter periplasmic adaptor subunit [Desulfobacterales bacterium]